MSAADTLKVAESEDQKADVYQKQAADKRSQLQYDLNQFDDDSQREAHRSKAESEISSLEASADTHRKEAQRLRTQYEQELQAELEQQKAENEVNAEKADRRKKQIIAASMFRL